MPFVSAMLCFHHPGLWALWGLQVTWVHILWHSEWSVYRGKSPPQTHQRGSDDGNMHVRKFGTPSLQLSWVVGLSPLLLTLCLGSVCCCSAKKQHHEVCEGYNQPQSTPLAPYGLHTGKSTPQWPSSERTPWDHTRSATSLLSHSTRCKTVSNVHTSKQLHLALEVALKWHQCLWNPSGSAAECIAVLQEIKKRGDNIDCSLWVTSTWFSLLGPETVHMHLIMQLIVLRF